METGLADKGAIVTGAASGIAKATVRSLLAEGARVAAVDRDADGLAALGAATPGQCYEIVADLSRVRETVSAMEDAIRHLGRVHVLVNCAGVGYRANLVETTDDEYETMFAVNVRAVFLTCRTVIPHMLSHGGGVIVNVASSLALKAASNRAVYAATKAAVTALTRSIAVDFGPRGIRANCVAPGTTDTPWIAHILAGAPNAEELRAQMAARQAVGRLGRPEEIAAVICFLASEPASFVHGATFAVDGGQTAW